MRLCPRCNTENPDDAIYCLNCGLKLPGTMLAIVCPNCGKVCPLGTKQCPVCHHRLPQKAQRLPVPQSSRRLNSKVLGIIAGIALVIFVAFMAYNLNHGFTNISNSPYTVINISYYRNHQQKIITQYFIVKQFVGQKSQDRFEMAYLGAGKKGLNQVRNNDIGRLQKIFKNAPHYQFKVSQRQANLTGPYPTKIKLTRQMVRSNNSISVTKFPDFEKRLFRCRVSGKPQYRYIRLWDTVTTVNDD